MNNMEKAIEEVRELRLDREERAMQDEKREKIREELAEYLREKFYPSMNELKINILPVLRKFAEDILEIVERER